jgi:mannose-6-phosphate isomerase-like protein (cupin superfamily)
MTTAATTTTDAFWFVRDLSHIKVRGSETNDAWSMHEVTCPGGDMPPLHVHHRDDEAFYVLVGELTLFVGDRKLQLGAGDCAVAPRGVPHTYRVESDGARVLVVNSPAGFERFVAEAGVPAEAETLPPGPPAISPERLAEIAAGYGIEILGPPGTLP